MNNSFRKKIIITLIIIILIILGTLAYYLLSKESFESEITNVLLEDIKNDQDYHQCISENDQLAYSSNGKYSDCEKTLHQLSYSGINVNDDIGYGKMNDVCPISSLLKSPSSCLIPRLDSQKKMIDDTNQIFKNSPKNIEVNKIFNKFNLNAYRKNLDNIYADKEIMDTVKYLKENRLKTSNDPYESTINNIVNPSPTPVNTEIPLTEEDIEISKFKLGY
jgi:hypothetical protein